MKKNKLLRITAILLTFSIVLSMSSTVFAANGDPVYYDQNVNISEFRDGYIFIQKTEEKSVAIITSNTEHTIYASIMYAEKKDVVYQWIIDDYPEEFCASDPSFWNGIILYIEENTNEATLVDFWYEEANENDPELFSSAGADLIERMQELEGFGYTDKYIKMRIMDSHTYRMYETKEFKVIRDGSYSWKDGASLASIAAGIAGLATSGVASTICGVLGLVFSGLGMVLPAGSVNKYICAVLYTRYIKVDYGSREYAHAYKIIYYDGCENADLNSDERADILVETRYETYDMNQSEEYFNNGIFDSAYKMYTGGF